MYDIEQFQTEIISYLETAKNELQFDKSFCSFVAFPLNGGLLAIQIPDAPFAAIKAVILHTVRAHQCPRVFFAMIAKTERVGNAPHPPTERAICIEATDRRHGAYFLAQPFKESGGEILFVGEPIWDQLDGETLLSNLWDAGKEKARTLN